MHTCVCVCAVTDLLCLRLPQLVLLLPSHETPLSPFCNRNLALLLQCTKKGRSFEGGGENCVSGRAWVCVCVFVFVCVRVCVCMRARVQSVPLACGGKSVLVLCGGTDLKGTLSLLCKLLTLLLSLLSPRQNLWQLCLYRYKVTHTRMRVMNRHWQTANKGA